MNPGGSAHVPMRQEEDEVATAPIVWIAIAAIAIGLAGVFFASLLLYATTGRVARHGSVVEGPPSGERSIANVEQTSIRDNADGIDLRRKQREELSRYRWVDRDAGVASIPIERAIDLVLQAPQ